MQLQGLYEVLTNTAASLVEFAQGRAPVFQLATLTGYSLLRVLEASQPGLITLHISSSANLFWCDGTK